MKTRDTTKIKKKLAGSLGKYGIKGSTGLGVGGFFHVSAPYDSNGLVFVEHTYKRYYVEDGKKQVEKNDSWKRMSLANAKKQKKRIILCSICDKPAVSLDHLWPYEVLYNRCKEHYGQKIGQEEIENRSAPPSSLKKD